MDTDRMNHVTPYGPAPRRRRYVWMVIGITLAVLLTIAGLAVVGGVVLFYIGLSHYGSNK